MLGLAIRLRRGSRQQHWTGAVASLRRWRLADAFAGHAELLADFSERMIARHPAGYCVYGQGQ